MAKDIVRYGDEAMFEAAPMMKNERGLVTPLVFLLSATPDPLGAIAAGFRMYAGKPTYSLADITDDERRQYWDESLKTHLKAPWEFVDMHFFIEGVTRSFTHQMVRQRTAVYAQESLRFAVKEGFAQEVPLPPMVANDENAVEIWSKACQAMEDAYLQLVNHGIPAEDARGLLPHAVSTRLNYKTNFRNLIETIGVRLCTQAQFEWRSVALGIMQAIHKYNPDGRNTFVDEEGAEHDRGNWQFMLLGTPIAQTFTPICYKANKCTFMGNLDRGCTIRDRVQAFAEHGVSSDRWGQGWGFGPEGAQEINGIRPEEWMADPLAGITDVYNTRPHNA